MTDADIGFLSAADLLAQYRARALSPVEVVGAVLRHIGRQEPALNAMVLTTADAAMEGARRAEAAYAEGTARKLEGVPVTIKDFAANEGRADPDGQPHIRGPRAGRGHALRVPPAVVRGEALHAAAASLVSQTVKLPRWRRAASWAASWAAELVARRFCLGVW